MFTRASPWTTLVLVLAGVLAFVWRARTAEAERLDRCAWAEGRLELVADASPAARLKALDFYLEQTLAELRRVESQLGDSPALHERLEFLESLAETLRLDLQSRQPLPALERASALIDAHKDEAWAHWLRAKILEQLGKRHHGRRGRRPWRSESDPRGSGEP